MCYKNIPAKQPSPEYIVPLKQWPNIGYAMPTSYDTSLIKKLW